MPIWEFLETYGARLVSGTLITSAQFVLATLIAVAVALCAGLGKLSGNWLIRGISVVYIEIFRGTPMIVQAMVIYYGASQYLGLNIPAMVAAFLVVSVNTGAYMAEIVRAAIQSIDKGQLEASRALGMTYGQAMRRIIIPQSYRRLIPPISNEFIMVLKDTALVSAIALADLMRRTNLIQTKTASALVYIPAMLLYLLLTTMFTFVAGKMEKRYAIYD